MSAGRLYATATNEAAWPGALQARCDVLGCAGVQLLAARPDGSGVPFSAVAGIAPEVEAEHRAYYASVCPRLAHAARNPDFALFTEYDFTDEAGIDRSEFHAWLARAADFRYAICARLPASEGLVGAVAAQFTRRQGHPQREEVARLRLLLPHLARALDLGRRLGEVDLRRRAAEEALERTGCGVAVLDRRGRVAFANRAALAILADADGLAVRAGSLVAGDARANRTLAGLVAGAVATSAGAGLSPGGTMRVPRPSLRPAYVVRAFPLPAGGPAWLSPEGRSGAILLMHDPGRAERPDPRAVAAVHGLSPGEGRLAAALAAGVSVREYATGSGLSVHTARWRLKRALAKAGCRSQAELVRLLVGGAELVA